MDFDQPDFKIFVNRYNFSQEGKQMQNIDPNNVELIRKSGFFDEEFYLANYSDVAMVGIDPVVHYLWIGAALKRNPSPNFSTEEYLSANPDVARSNLNPLVHYIKWGSHEGRRAYAAIWQDEKDLRAPAKRLMERHTRDWDDDSSDLIGQQIRQAHSAAERDLVSIIMPTRNRADKIRSAIQSALCQTHENFEIIVIDDGSTDNTRQVIASITDPRLRYIHNDGPHGVSRARNLGLDTSTGDWVFFLDSDNTWMPEMVETMLKFAEANTLSAGYCAANIIDDLGQRKSVLYADFDFESLIRQNFIDMNCFFMRRDGDFLKFRFDESLYRLVDWDFILRISARTRIVGLPYLGVRYYDGRAQRISNSEYKQNTEFQNVVNKIRVNARQAIIEELPIEDSSSKRIAIVWHVYHTDNIEYFLNKIEMIEFDFDLFVTTSLQPDVNAISQIRRACPNAKVYFFPNVGADIAPFLELASTLKNYSLVGKIHTKRNMEQWGDTWRRELMDSVLRSRSYIDKVVALFQSSPHLKLVCSKNLYKHGRRCSTPETLMQVNWLAEKTGLERHINEEWAFAAGTMFWIRPEVLQPIARFMCDSSGYSGRVREDGDIEHGLERVLGLALCAYPEAKVGLADSSGEISIHSPVEGYNKEAITNTLRRLCAQRANDDDRAVKVAVSGTDPKAGSASPRSAVEVPKSARYSLRFYPDYTVNNAYQNLLYKSLEGIDVTPGDIDSCIALLSRSGSGDTRVVFHLHWTNPIFANGSNEADAAQRASDFVAKLRLFHSRGGRIIWTIHNVISHEPKYLDVELDLHRTLANLSDWIHVHHLAVVEDARPHYTLPPEKVLVAAHGNYIGTLNTEITSAEARERLGIPMHATVFLFLGQIRSYKGVDELIDTFNELSSHHDNVWLVMAGKMLGVSQQEVAARLGSHGRVVFRPGYVADEDMQIYLNSADVMVLPYRKVSTSGSALLAMSFALPVICPASGLLSYLIEDGKEGFLYPPDEQGGLRAAMERFLVSAPAERKEMSAFALTTARLHSWEESASALQRYMEALDFGRMERPNINGSSRRWFVRGERDTLKGKRCIAIILHYQNLDDTRECIDRITMQSPDVGLIVISNNEALSDIRQLAREYPDLYVVQAEDNVGYAAANNFGLSVCRELGSEFFWIINPDIVVPPSYFDELVERIEDWPDTDFFGTTIVPSHNPNKVLFCGGKVRLDSGAAPAHMFMGARLEELPVSPFECDYLTGANIFGRTSALGKAGYMPEEYFLYFEETDWFLSMMVDKRSAKPLVFPDLFVKNHKRSEAGLVPSRYYIYYFIRNSLLFGRKFTPDQVCASEKGARTFADAWLRKVAQAAPERLTEFELLIERALDDGRHQKVGRVAL
ncbi:glycosyltransferase [Erythrobacter sanguineus]|nr:glycosyltransferase [Erythrobacter sanguineus]